MTPGERRIVEYLVASDATELSDLPDWFLALMEDVGGDVMSHELITAASFLLVRRERPGIGFDPARLEELAPKIQAFRLSCGFERLRRAGFTRGF